MKCELRSVDLALKREFAVAGASVSTKRNHFIIMEDIGIGEAAGSVHYGATEDEIRGDLDSLVHRLRGVTCEDCPHIIEYLPDNMTGPAKCAISTAWLDCQCKREKKPLHHFFDLPAPCSAPTSVTVSIGDFDDLNARLSTGIACIKVKMNADEELCMGFLDTMTKFPKTKYRIDVNGSWTRDLARRLTAEMALEQAELIEQPFTADKVEDWKYLKEKTEIPLFMDESIVDENDVHRVVEFVDGINIKIQKSGCLKSAVQAMKAAHDLGLKVMLGCMIESSVGIAAAYQLSGLADFIDLDGRLLLAEDPFQGLAYRNECIEITGPYGHGVSFA